MLTVYYDADCGFCTECARLLVWLDRGRRLRLVPLQKAAGDHPAAPPIDRLVATMHAVDDANAWVTGADAWLAIAERVPMLRPTASIGRLPVVHGLVEMIYAVVARNRGRISAVLGSRVCKVDPQR